MLGGNHVGLATVGGNDLARKKSVGVEDGGHTGAAEALDHAQHAHGVIGVTVTEDEGLHLAGAHIHGVHVVKCAVLGDSSVEEEGGLLVASGDGDEHGDAVFGSQGGLQEGIGIAHGAAGDGVAGSDGVGEVVH